MLENAGGEQSRNDFGKAKNKCRAFLKVCTASRAESVREEEKVGGRGRGIGANRATRGAYYEGHRETFKGRRFGSSE